MFLVPSLPRQVSESTWKFPLAASTSSIVFPLFALSPPMADSSPAQPPREMLAVKATANIIRIFISFSDPSWELYCVPYSIFASTLH